MEKNKTYEEWLCKTKGIVFTQNGATAGMENTGPVTFIKQSKVKDRNITPGEALMLNSGINHSSNLECNIYLLPGAPDEFLISEIEY